MATAVMAWFTRGLAVEARSERLQTVSHHQQLLSPFCVLRDATSKVEGNVPRIALKVQNIGSGPAVHVNLRITPAKAGLIHSGIGMVQYIGPMLTGETTPEIANGFEGWGGREPTGIFLVTLEFENIFGAWGVSEWVVNAFAASHTLLQPADAKIQSTIPPKSEGRQRVDASPP